MTGGDRSPHADVRAAWARICDDFPDLRDRATEYGYEERLAKLVERTRGGERRIVLWDMLLGELAARAGDERFMTWRDPTRADGAWPSPLDPDRTGFACPGGLCDHRAAWSPGERPWCALFGRPMTDLGPDGA